MGRTGELPENFLKCRRAFLQLNVKKGNEKMQRYKKMKKKVNLEFTKTDTVIRMDGAMAIMSHSDFKCPIGKGSVETMPHYFLET